MTQKGDRASQAIELLGQQKLELSDRDREEIVERIRPTALIIDETIRIEGESELCRPVSALAWSGLAAGLSMGFFPGGSRFTPSKFTPAILEFHHQKIG